MSLGVVDILIIIFLVLGAIVGFKNGAIKEGTKFIGFFAIVIIAFLLKDDLMVILYKNLPFLNFFGFIRGLTALNILFYQLVSFLIIFLALLFILRVILVVTGLIEWLIKMTVFLSFPSKILGTVIGVLEYYVYIFLVLYVLTMPMFNLTFISNSKLGTSMLENTPILSEMVGDNVKVYSDVLEILKDKEENKVEVDTYQTNELVLAILLDNKLISIDAAKNLIETNKIVVNDETFLDSYTDDGNFYETLKSDYHEHETVLEYMVSSLNEKSSAGDLEVTTTYISNKTCAAAGICNNDDYIQLNVTIKKGNKIIKEKIHTDGHHHELLELGMYVNAEVRDGWIYVSITK